MKPSILDVKGIGLSTLEILAQHGIKTIEDLADAGFDRLISIPGFSGVRASSVIQEAKNLLSDGSASTELGVIGNLYNPKKDKKSEKKKKGKGKKDAKSTKKNKKSKQDKAKKKDKQKDTKKKEVAKKDKKKNKKKAKIKNKKKK